MTLQELKERIDILLECNPRSKDCVVGIPDFEFGGMGGIPIDELKVVSKGFDWNSGSVFLITQSSLDKRKK